MNRSALIAMILLAPAYSMGQIQLVQQDSAHTLFTPNTPDPGRSGQTVQLPQGGIGVTTGGTSHYQTLATPGGGSAVAVPNGVGSSNVIGTGGRTTPPR
jgi:hypothetical protein